MKERPILYSAPMVRARLAGIKTNTRRLMKDPHYGTPPARTDQITKQHENSNVFIGRGWENDPCPIKIVETWRGVCPYGQPGDQLWTRETFHITHADYDLRHVGRDRIFLMGHYLADGVPFHIILTREETDKFEKWKRQEGTFPAIFMFRSLSRDTATITAIRAERLQDITEADALAEGMDMETAAALMHPEELATLAAAHILAPHALSRIIFETVWASIHGPDSWKDNPWVWVITFQPLPT